MFPTRKRRGAPYRRIIGPGRTRNGPSATEKEVAAMSALITDTNPTPSGRVSHDPGSAGATPSAAALDTDRFLSEAERVRALAVGQAVLSQSRCVDDLLDLL